MGEQGLLGEMELDMNRTECPGASIRRNESEGVIGQMLKGLCTQLKLLLTPENNWSHESFYTQNQIHALER